MGYFQKSLIFNCHSDYEKAKYIAETLISTWRNMNYLSLGNNQKFIAILQPINLSENDIVSKQYKAVYPIIREKMKSENFKFLDLSNSLNENNDLFFDFCHLIPKG